MMHFLITHLTLKKKKKKLPALQSIRFTNPGTTYSYSKDYSRNYSLDFRFLAPESFNNSTKSIKGGLSLA